MHAAQAPAIAGSSIDHRGASGTVRGGSRLGLRGSAGFSLVELLVAIVLAGIAFAAMAPLFIGAQDVAAADKMRTIALSVARDKIEKIRQLDYDQITVDNLQSPSFAGGGFGTTWTAYSGTSPKDFSVTYAVEDVGGGQGQPGAYKKVTVTVGWTAPPRVKAAVLSTFINRQYAGPTIVDLDLSPLDGEGRLYSSPVTVQAAVAADDIASTTKVLFFISDNNGSVILQAEDTSGAAGRYSIGWDCSTAPPGLYVFRAQGYAGDNVGNTWERAATLFIDNPPPPVTNLSAAAGDQAVNLAWDPCTAPQFDHYELWRGTSPGGESLLLDALTANGYTDTDVTNGTTYYYKVRAVDTEDRTGGFSDEVSVTPNPPIDTTPPTMPGGFSTSAVNNTAVLTWTASTDPGEPASGVQGYYIYRDGGGTPYATYDGAGAGTIEWIDLINWSTTHSYYVVAFDGVGLTSPQTATRSVTTGAAPKFTLKCSSNKNSTQFTVVQNDSVPPDYSWGTKTGKNNVTWSNLPIGTYTVTARKSGYSDQTQTFTRTSTGTQTLSFTF